MSKEAKNPIKFFFNLGNKVTKGNPVNKAKFDYYLYWIIFLAFVFVALNYYYNFFTQWKFSFLMWALILSGITWFNYWGLVGFKTIYDSTKRSYESIKVLDTPKEIEEKDDSKEMLENFGDTELKKEVEAHE